ELFTAKGGSFVVLFVSSKHLEEAQRILAENGFTEFPLPTGTGLPGTAVAELENEIKTASEELRSRTRRSPVLTRSMLR
ncbi:MAG TPA: hypothetical protein PKX52_08665, partial [Methanomassiliicoccaceae archaeon]|nr:hypothetical protein [Methanomassiliicoccaceae archaeon]